jgi:hypothetical protein
MGMEGIDLFREVEIDHGPVIDPKRSAESVERDLESTVEIPSVWRFEVKGQIYADQRIFQRYFYLGRDDPISPRSLDDFGDTFVERLRRFAQYAPSADGHVLIVDAGRQWQGQAE